MEWFKDTLELQTANKGMHNITQLVEKKIRTWNIQEGLCFLYNPHTSASLIISEGFAGASQQDVEEFYERLVPEGAAWYRHTSEGLDDSPSHIRTTLTLPNLTIPIDNSELSLGTWQEIFFFEHRTGKRSRRVLLRCLKIS